MKFKKKIDYNKNRALISLSSDLPNTLLQDTTDVALIVPNLERDTRRPDNDMVAQMYSSRLRAHGIKHPIQVSIIFNY